LIGAPRHLSQHPGGFVLTHDRLDMAPIEPVAMKDRQVIEWDKGDIDAPKFMKVDGLAIGMLTSASATPSAVRRRNGAAVASRTAHHSNGSYHQHIFSA
jgi:error-prone DNA polymerase